MKILVADDSKTNLALIKASLEKLGHEVVAASDGQEAITLFQLMRPDLIILDVMMKGMDGFECAKRIRAISQEDWIPIIFLSGSVNDESIAKGIDAGGDDYLTKPFSEITLAAKIKAMQRISSMRQSLFEATQKLSLLSTTDTLTGANNRLQFNKTINEKIAAADRKQSTLALLALDLDNFKSVNDTYGHPMGDLLLIEVTKKLQTCLRVNDFLARIGGDEFVVILDDINDKKVVDIIAQKIINALSTPLNLEGQRLQSNCSIGIVFFPDDGLDSDILTKNADLALYHAKKSGRNRFHYFNESQSKEHVENTFEKDLTPVIFIQNKIAVLRCLAIRTAVCIPLKFINKILPLTQLQAVPNSPTYFVGLMNWAGKTLPIIDLGVRLNRQRLEPYTLDTPILFCSDGGNEVGLIVDKIVGLYEIDNEDRHLQEKDSLHTTVTINHELFLLINIPKLLGADIEVGEL